MDAKNDFVQTISILSAAILLSCIIIWILTSVVIDPYLHATDLVTNTLDFYANNKEENKIYFIGDSLTLYGVNADTIEMTLNYSNYSYKVYNLAKNCAAPLTQIVYLTNLIESKPKIVIIGTQSGWFTKDRYKCANIQAQFSYAADKIKLDNYTRQLFNSSEQSIIQANYLQILTHKKQLLIPGLRLALANQLRYWNVKNVGFLGTVNPTKFTFKGHKSTEIIYNKKKKPSVAASLFSCGKVDNDNKKAFRYMVKRITENGIHVIIINMPTNSDFYAVPNNSMEIDKEARKDYLDVVTNVGCPYYDLETLLSPIEFQDTKHCNLLGQRNLSQKMTEILKVEVRNASKQH